jgi:hypothetical protein
MGIIQILPISSAVPKGTERIRKNLSHQYFVPNGTGIDLNP